MTHRVFAIITIAVACVSSPVWADASLAKAKNCMSCHATDKKLVGPAFKDVAKKYAGDNTAIDRLALKIQKGGAGVWGPLAMPANNQVSDADAKKLATWALSVK